MSRNQKESAHRINIAEIRFEVQKDRKSAQVKVEYARYNKESGVSNKIMLRLPVACLWIDPVSGDACKAYIQAGTSEPHKLFVRDIMDSGSLSCSGRGSCYITADTDGTIRYGANTAGGNFYYDSDRSDGYQSYNIYDSKEMVLQELIKEISETKPVGGAQLVSMSGVDESILTSAGMDKVSDVMGIGVNMWKGDANQAFRGDSRVWTSRGDRKVRDNVETFLTMLDDSLKGK
jgi:hypothetical protein